MGEGCGLPSARAGALAGADAGAHGQSEVGEGPNEMVTTRFVPRASGVVRATTPRSRFSCAFRYTLSEAKMAPGEGGAALSEADEYALLAFEGKWQHVVPSRSCLLYK